MATPYAEHLRLWATHLDFPEKSRLLIRTMIRFRAKELLGDEVNYWNGLKKRYESSGAAESGLFAISPQ